MAFTQSDLIALESSIKSGTKEVRFQDRTVVYQNLDDMLKLRSAMIVELSPTGTAPAIQRQVRLVTDRGF